MTFIVTNFQQLYQRQFGSKPKVPPALPFTPEVSGINIETNQQSSVSTSGSALTASYLGQEIWLPCKFFELDVSKFGVTELLLPYAVLRITLNKTIIKTPLAERSGTVKEQYSVDDCNISLKGFLIGYDSTGKFPVWPEKDIKLLNELWMLNESVKFDNALSNIFVGSDQRLVIRGLDFPEVEGGKKNYRPFTMQLESDTIFTLELQ